MTLIPALAVQQTGLVSLDHFCVFLFVIPAHRVQLHRPLAMALQPVLTVQPIGRPLLAPFFSCLVGVLIASVSRFDSILASQPI